MAKPTKADYSVMSDTYKRLTGMVVIDKHDIDNELTTQADKYREVTEAYALCLSYNGAAKDEFDQVQADLLRTVHAEHEKEHAGKEKVPRLTDTAANAKVMEFQDWIDAKALRRDWDDMVQRLSGLKEVFAQRSSMLKELPALWIAGYIQGNSAGNQPRSRNEMDADNVRRVVTERRAAGRSSEAEQPEPPTERRRPVRA